MVQANKLHIIYINVLKMKRLFVLVLLMHIFSIAESQDWKLLIPPVETGIWIQPANEEDAVPVWGFKNGIRVGLAPMPGPRGLLRIYTPFLGHKDDKMINFIAIEPIPAGEKVRGFSELEFSHLDQVNGKRFWSSNEPVCAEPHPINQPARGVIQNIDGIEFLTVYVFSEKFDNGANVYVKISFREDRPYEIELTGFSCYDSKPLKNLILTATMGNYARLRNLYLDNFQKKSALLWPDYRDIHFTPHDFTEISSMIKDKQGGVYFIAGPDEKRPDKAEYDKNTRNNWKYYGKTATQFWYCPDPDSTIQGLVNGRYTYWASESPIPGGISFENFELKRTFKNGEKSVFGVVPLSPERLISKIRNNKYR